MIKYVAVFMLVVSAAFGKDFRVDTLIVKSNVTVGAGGTITINGVGVITNIPASSVGTVTNVTGGVLTLSIDGTIIGLSTNGWAFGGSQTPWTSDIDGGGFNLSNVLTGSFAVINLGDNDLVDLLNSKLSTNDVNGLIGSTGSNLFLWSGGFTLNGESITNGAAVTITAGTNVVDTLAATLAAGNDANSGVATNFYKLGLMTSSGTPIHGVLENLGEGVYVPAGDLAWIQSIPDGPPDTIQTNRLWHSGNDGTGSTLDADMLDGNHAASFVLTNGALDLLRLNNGSGLTNIPLTALQTMPLTNFSINGQSVTNGSSVVSPKFNVGISPMSGLTFGSTNDALVVGYAGDDAYWAEAQFSDTTEQRFRVTVSPAATSRWTGGALTNQIWWRGTSTVGAVVWQISMVGATNNGLADLAYQNSISVTQTVSSVTSNINIAELIFTPTNCPAGSLWLGELKRLTGDAGDTMVNDARMLNWTIKE
jgi:hypothetical protein